LHFSGIDWVQLGKWCISQKMQLTDRTIIVVYTSSCYGPFFGGNLSSAPKQKDVDEYSQYSCQLLKEELLTLVWLQKLQRPKKPNNNNNNNNNHNNNNNNNTSSSSSSKCYICFSCFQVTGDLRPLFDYILVKSKVGQLAAG